MNWFYQPGVQEGNHFLEDEEFRHCTKVLRNKIGDEIQIIDGNGNYFVAIINSIEKQRCHFSITDSKKEIPKQYGIHIAVAPTKNQDRLEWFVEKAVELGVDEISFLSCDHSERISIKQARIDRVAISALKQCGRATLPLFSAITDFKTFVEMNFEGEKFMAYVDNTNPNHLFHLAKPSKKYVVLIGPEGDFSTEELKNAEINGFQKISLGNYRLRTETAAITACQILHLVNV